MPSLNLLKLVRTIVNHIVSAGENSAQEKRLWLIAKAIQEILLRHDINEN